MSCDSAKKLAIVEVISIYPIIKTYKDDSSFLDKWAEKAVLVIIYLYLANINDQTTTKTAIVPCKMLEISIG